MRKKTEAKETVPEKRDLQPGDTLRVLDPIQLGYLREMGTKIIGARLGIIQLSEVLGAATKDLSGFVNTIMPETIGYAFTANWETGTVKITGKEIL